MENMYLNTFTLALYPDPINYESLVILLHNEFPNLRIGLMAAPSEYTVISHKIMPGPGYQSSKFA